MNLFKKPTLEFWRTVILALAVGAVSGTLAAIAAWSSLLAYQGTLITESTPFITTRQNSKNSEQEFIRTLKEEGSRSLADIFLKKSNEEAPYLNSEALGRGVVFTNDGWIISHRTVIDSRRKNELRIGAGPTVFPVEKIIEDVETGVLFIKISATNLQPAIFGASEELESGDSVYLLDSSLRVLVSRIYGKEARLSAAVSSDLLGTHLILSPEVSEIGSGGPLWNEAGEVVGIVISEKGIVTRVVPSLHLSPLFVSLLAKEELLRPTLGVRGSDLSGGRRVDGGRSRGFLLEESGTAVAPGSPAKRAGLLAGDLITKIDVTPLNNEIDLAEFLLFFKPGETVDLGITRGKEDLVIPVTFGERNSGRKY